MSIQFSSVAQSCPTLWDPMDCSTPGFPVHNSNSRSLLKLMSIELVMPSNHLICRPLLLLPSIFPSFRVFSNESVLCIRSQSIGVSASASVLPMNIQDWFPLGWTGWISLQSKGLWKVFSNTTVQKHLLRNAHFSGPTPDPNPLQYLAWKIPWTEEPGGTLVHWVAKSPTWLKWLNTAQQPRCTESEPLGEAQ